MNDLWGKNVDWVKNNNKSFIDFEMIDIDYHLRMISIVY